MSRKLVGSLSLPDGSPMAYAEITLTAKRNEIDQIVRGTNSTFVTSDAGTYSVDVENGFYNIGVSYGGSGSGAPMNWYLGSAWVESGDDIPFTELLVANDSVIDPVDARIQQMLSDAQASQAAAKTSEDAAKTSEDAAKASELAAGLSENASDTVLIATQALRDETELDRQAVAAELLIINDLASDVEADRVEVEDNRAIVAADKIEVGSLRDATEADRIAVAQDKAAVTTLRDDTQVFRDTAEQFKNDAETAAIAASGALRPVAGWDASVGTNPPDPTDGTTPWYRITVAGTVPALIDVERNPTGAVSIGDNVYYGGVAGVWFHIDNTEKFTSINGKTSGAIVLNTEDIAEGIGGTNLYHTEARVRAITATETETGTVEVATLIEAKSAAIGKFPDAAGVHAAFSQYGLGRRSTSAVSNLDLYQFSGFFITPAFGVTPLPAGWVQTDRYEIIVSGDANAYGFQLIHSIDGLKAAWRSRSSDTWNPWVEEWNNANFDPATKAQLVHTHDASSVSSVGVTESGVTRIAFPSGGSLSLPGADVGAIKIALPVLWTNTAVKLRVEFFDFSDNESFTLCIAGYNYSGDSAWNHESAQIIGSNVNRNLPVRWGHDDAKACVWVGEIDSTWTAAKATVTEVIAAQSGVSINTWKDGWAVSLETAFDTVQTTITDTLPAADYNKLVNIPDLGQGKYPSATLVNWTTPAEYAKPSGFMATHSIGSTGAPVSNQVWYYHTIGIRNDDAGHPDIAIVDNGDGVDGDFYWSMTRRATELPRWVKAASAADIVTVTNLVGGLEASIVTGYYPKAATDALLEDKSDTEHEHTATDITQDSTHRFITDTERAIWNSGGVNLGSTGSFDPVYGTYSSAADYNKVVGWRDTLAGNSVGLPVASTSVVLEIVGKFGPTSYVARATTSTGRTFTGVGSSTVLPTWTETATI